MTCSSTILRYVFELLRLRCLLLYLTISAHSIHYSHFELVSWLKRVARYLLTTIVSATMQWVLPRLQVTWRMWQSVRITARTQQDSCAPFWQPLKTVSSLSFTVPRVISMERQTCAASVKQGLPPFRRRTCPRHLRPCRHRQ